MTIDKFLTYISFIVTGASFARIGLHWLRQALAIWISEGSGFWKVYDKLELTVAYVSVSLAAFGKQKASASVEAPITIAAAPAEGKIQ